MEILSARGGGADKKSKLGLGRRAVCRGFLEAHNPKSPKMGLGEVARGRSLSKKREAMFLVSATIGDSLFTFQQRI